MFSYKRSQIFSMIINVLIAVSLLVSFSKFGLKEDSSITQLIGFLIAKVLIEDFFGLSAFLIPVIFIYGTYKIYKKIKIVLSKEIIYWLAIFNVVFTFNILLTNFNFFWNSSYSGYFPKLLHTLIVGIFGTGGIKSNIISFFIEFLIFLVSLFLFLSIYEKIKFNRIINLFKIYFDKLSIQINKIKSDFLKGEKILIKIDENHNEYNSGNSFFIRKIATDEDRKIATDEDESVLKGKEKKAELNVGNNFFQKIDDEILDTELLFEDISSRNDNEIIRFGNIKTMSDMDEISNSVYMDDHEEQEDIEKMEEAEFLEEKNSFKWPMVMNEFKKNKKRILGDKVFLNKNKFNFKKLNKEQIKENIKKLETTLNNFGIGSKVENVITGPVVTQYQISIDAGIKVNKIYSLSDNIALALSTTSVRISFVPEKGFLGIEIPNVDREMVVLRDLIEDDFFTMSEADLPIALGKSIVGDNVMVDFSQMPHLLVAGSTGSGKSVCVNSMITSLLMKCSPDDLRFVMIDPKMVELTIYNDIPHLLTPVVTVPKKASKILKWVIEEMELRYRLLEYKRVRNIKSYNQMVKHDDDFKTMPYIMVVIDEFADLMLVAKKEIEDSISRLAAMSRAVGIHLLLATQRPSVDVITGVIKANFPSRIAFQVSSKIDSRTILDESGAEQLLGKGDMLFSNPKNVGLQRIQCGFLGDEEIQNIVDNLKMKGNMMDFTDEIFKENKTDEIDDNMDELYDEALNIILENGKASTSFIQRKLKIGYNRAARIIEQMEERGVLSVDQKNRKILVER